MKFITEAVLPSQFFSSAATADTPERRLMRAVLEDAVEAYLKHKGKLGRRARRLFKETEEWFLSSDATWLYSFENICEVLEFDAQAVREAIFRKDSQINKRRGAVV